MTTSVVLVVDGYKRKYMTDTTELSPRLSDACVFHTPSETTKLQQFQSFLEQQYPQRVTLQAVTD